VSFTTQSTTQSQAFYEKLNGLLERFSLSRMEPEVVETPYTSDSLFSPIWQGADFNSSHNKGEMNSVRA